jgi:DNA ligase-1
MPDIEEGESVEVKGSSSTYTLRNDGGVYSCSCPAWRHQSLVIEQRTCKHLKAYRGADREAERVGKDDAARSPAAPRKSRSTPSSGEAESGSEPALLLAHKWDNETDVTGWWMSEKLDGVRAFWNGERFVSRLGNTFVAPDWFVEGLPSDPLDGELWMARGAFQKTVSIVRRQDESKHWEQLRYLIFDAPRVEQPFEERLAWIEEMVDDRSPDFAMPVKQEKCRGYDHLRSELERIEQLGGEGLMLREPRSRYVAGRSTSLLKVKTFYDSEARVIEHLPGAGKHEGRLGALRVELKDGTRFSVGTGFSDEERRRPPRVGAVITFRYQELTEAGVPRFPSYVGERIDLDWASADGAVVKAKK